MQHFRQAKLRRKKRQFRKLMEEIIRHLFLLPDPLGKKGKGQHIPTDFSRTQRKENLVKKFLGCRSLARLSRISPEKKFSPENAKVRKKGI